MGFGDLMMEKNKKGNHGDRQKLDVKIIWQ